jgi:lipid-A-disaccharide synthase
MEKHPKILIVCGEASGDLHGSALVRAVKELAPSADFFGAGGPKLKAEGVELIYDLTSIAVIGFFEVLKNLATFKRVFHTILEETRKRRPDLAVLIDYPGFNLALAKELRKLGIPVIYYISPQVWAWGRNRVKAIKRDVDKMLVILPFEKAFYERHGLTVTFVGHPALDSVKPSMTKSAFCAAAGLDAGKLTIALLPGSREKEIRSLLPVMLKACAIIRSYMSPDAVQFLVLRSPSVPEPVFAEQLRTNPDLPVKMVAGLTYDGIASSDFCLVCSGTATLETGIIGTPMVILYKVHPLTWLYMRLLIRIPFVGLVNIVKGKKVAEEFIQLNCVPWGIADSVLPVIKDRERLAELRQELAGIRKELGAPGASRRAAEEVVRFLPGTR